MRDVMIDLETLSVDSNSCVLALGAVYFNEEEIGDQFYQTIGSFKVKDGVMSLDDSLTAQVCKGATVDKGTMKFWLTQPQEIRASLEEPGGTTEEVLEAFYRFIKDKRNVRIWGNGADFDNVILRNLYIRHERIAPWVFYHNRCYRTIKNFMPDLKASSENKHHALSDAINQVKHMQQILQVLDVKL